MAILKHKYVAIYITKNINVGLDGMAEEEAVGKAGGTSMQQKFACRQSPLTNTSKHCIKNLIFIKEKFM